MVQLRFNRSERGLTLIEVALMLIVVFALIGALAPTLMATVRHAETAAATTAMTEIQNQILAVLNDLNQARFTIDGSNNGQRVERLVSDGDIPQELSGAGSATWQAAVNNATGLTDFIERHLVTNNPRGNAVNAYPTAGVNQWRGAYLTAPNDSDPWGNRYAVNSQYLGGGAGGSNDVVVYSAGPDEVIDSAYTANPLAAGGDDLVVMVEP